MEKLQIKFDELCKKSWLIGSISKGVIGNTVKKKLDNWPTPTRNELLKMLEIEEVPSHYIFKNGERIT